MASTRLTISVDERTRGAEARIGATVLGKWRLERLLGVGGMAAVFEASHANGSQAAIKMLHSDLGDSRESRERFLAESYAANRVAHPGVVTVRDEGTTADGAVFLVMDLLRGQTLAERLAHEATPLSVVEVLEISSQLLDVLAHAHGRGIVHRDIKPENVFLTREGRIKLLDFGIARIDGATASTRETQPGRTLGTPAFMPPEQALGVWSALDGRSDLWSLGATMYLMLSGTPVRELGSPTEQLLGAMTCPVPSLAHVAPGLPRSVVAIVDRALAFDREERFPDARSMQLAVRAARSELRKGGSRVLSPPKSLEPTALSVRAARIEPPRERASVSTMRPVAAPSGSRGGDEKPPASALPFYLTLGFAVGLGIVFAARLTMMSPASPAAAAQHPSAEAWFPLGHSSAGTQVSAEPAPPLSSTASSAASSASRKPARPPSSASRRPSGNRPSAPAP